MTDIGPAIPHQVVNLEETMVAGSPLYVTDAEVETVLSACRVLVAVSARATAATNRLGHPAQLPILLALAGTAGSSLTELAASVQAPPATVARLCATLVEAGLAAHIEHAEDPANPSTTRLMLTGTGHELLTTTLNRRHQALELIMGRLPPVRRVELLAVLRELDIKPQHPADTGRRRYIISDGATSPEPKDGERDCRRYETGPRS